MIGGTSAAGWDIRAPVFLSIIEKIARTGKAGGVDRLPLTGTRVLDLTTRLAGSYASKLLCDAGADVVTAEPDGGHPLRRWTASSTTLPYDEDGALFRWLHGSRRSVEASAASALVPAADVVLVDTVVAHEAVAAAAPHVVVAVTDFGLTGPWRDRPATDLTLQAECGSVASRGVPELPPVAAGGRLGEWVAGVYAGAAALAALRAGGREDVDVSVFECMAVTLNMHEPLHAALAGSEAWTRWVQVPSVERAKDGWVCFSLVTGQQWLDFAAMIERPDLGDDPGLSNMLGRWPRRAEVQDAMGPWLRARTVEEVVDLATAFRLPVAHVSDGASVPAMEHFVAREVFAASPYGYPQPRPPFRPSAMALRGPAPAPAPGEHTTDVVAEWSPREVAVSPAGRPLEGVKVVDLTAFWAGPSGTAYLTALGADVVKVESVQRPDGIRFAGGQITQADGWWDWSWVFQASNPGKRGITLDLTSAEGVALLHRLLADADVLVENYSPRVLEQFGLTEQVLRSSYPSLVVVRMPAYGLDGPWTDRVGFALTMEALAGMATLTGHPEGTPTCPGGVLDPVAGMHGAFATLLALAHRDATGEGQLVEVPMIECALNVAAEPLLEHGAYGELLGRNGNRGQGAVLQDVFPCPGEEAWAAVSVGDADQAAALARVLEDLGAEAPDALTRPERWVAERDVLDKALGAFFAGQDRDVVVGRLVSAGVPAGAVRLPTVADRNPQHDVRGFYEVHEHPTLGPLRYPVLPTRFASWTGPVHRGPAPTLGQHTAEVLGLSAQELADLRARGVVGDRPAGL
jgi:crotonobetainyl-CoA:carnitine CoA-transferase CaiB-like acyl-CoA transferase